MSDVPSALPLDASIEKQVTELVRAARVREAAELAFRHGAWHRASVLYEQACEFLPAALAAMRAGERMRGLGLLAVGGDESQFAREIAQMDPTDAARLGEDLAAKRLDRFAALAFVRGARPTEAARSWEGAGAARESAASYEAGGDVRGAARVLEQRIAEAPESTRTLVALGDLLVRHSRFENALTSLQQIPSTSPDYPLAKPLLVACFEALGLRVAAGLDPSPNLEKKPRVNDVADAKASGAPELMFGRFRFEADVARSGSARVVRAFDEVQRHSVAIKSLHTTNAVGQGRDAWSRFVREVRIQSQMRHPHIVPVLDFFPDAPAIVTPWMDGGSLANRTREPMAPTRAVEIAIAVLSALGEAHRLGALHRDIKPANVLFDAAGSPRLADFGVAHLGEGDNTVTAAALGSLAYMSPEQREGRSASLQSDVFGVGVMLWELLTGRLPEERFAAGTLSRFHGRLNADHERVVRALFADDPNDRPEDAFAAARSLRDIVWPADVVLRPRASEAPPAPIDATRLVPGPTGFFDTWLARAVHIVPMTDTKRPVILAFASLTSPHLERVVRLDDTTSSAWLAVPPRDPTSRLGPEHRDALTRALAALHAKGVAHGAVDRDHVSVSTDGIPVLLFPRHEIRSASAQGDNNALNALF